MVMDIVIAKKPKNHISYLSDVGTVLTSNIVIINQLTGVHLFILFYLKQ